MRNTSVRAEKKKTLTLTSEEKRSPERQKMQQNRSRALQSRETRHFSLEPPL